MPDEPGDDFPRSDQRIDYLAPRWPESEWIDLGPAATLVEYELARGLFDGGEMIARWACNGFLRSRARNATFAFGSVQVLRHAELELVEPKYWRGGNLIAWNSDFSDMQHVDGVEVQDEDGVATYWHIEVHVADLRDCVDGKLVARSGGDRSAGSANDWIMRNQERGYNSQTGWTAYRREHPNGVKRDAFREDWNAVHARRRGRPKG